MAACLVSVLALRCLTNTPYCRLHRRKRGKDRRGKKRRVKRGEERRGGRVERVKEGEGRKKDNSTEQKSPDEATGSVLPKDPDAFMKDY